MVTVTTKTFKSGNSEAVRLPKEVAFGVGVELTIVRSGDVMTITPKKRVTGPELAEIMGRLPALPDSEIRDPDIFPDREGL